MIREGTVTETNKFSIVTKFLGSTERILGISLVETDNFVYEVERYEVCRTVQATATQYLLDLPSVGVVISRSVGEDKEYFLEVVGKAVAVKFDGKIYALDMHKYISIASIGELTLTKHEAKDSHTIPVYPSVTRTVVDASGLEFGGRYRLGDYSTLFDKRACKYAHEAMADLVARHLKSEECQRLERSAFKASSL